MNRIKVGSVEIKSEDGAYSLYIQGEFFSRGHSVDNLIEMFNKRFELETPSVARFRVLRDINTEQRYYYAKNSKIYRYSDDEFLFTANIPKHLQS